MDPVYTTYEMDGWRLPFPQDWKFSLDKEQRPPQVIFDIENAATLYISTWNWSKPETGEIAPVETVESFFLQAFEQQGIERRADFAAYYPEGFIVCEGKSITGDGYRMISFAVCADGCAISLYFVFEPEAEIVDCLQYIKGIERER